MRDNNATPTVGKYSTRGRPEVRAEFIDAFCNQAHSWFDENGECRTDAAFGKSRERMWCGMNFLAHPDPEYRKHGNRIVARTPIDRNAFQPTLAAEMLLLYPNQLEEAVRHHLLETVRSHLFSRIEHTLAVSGITNFSCMGAWFFVAASQLLCRYTIDHPFALPEPAVYSNHRLAAMALNVLRNLAYCAEHHELIDEFNSPTYTPISLHCMAKIVENAPNPEMGDLALLVEDKLWRETLDMFHPRLNLSCGPYSRAYRQTILGQITQARQLLSYTGLSRERSVAQLFQLQDPDIFALRDGDSPVIQPAPIWLMNTLYHVPVAAVEKMQTRQYPYFVKRFLPVKSTGLIDAKQHRWIPVQGDAIVSRAGFIEQVQHSNWVLGYRSRCIRGHSFPVCLHYALRGEIADFRDVRTVTAGVVFHGKPQEWTTNALGQKLEAQDFTHAGDVEVVRDGNSIRWAGHPFVELESLRTEEISVNAFIPLHFKEIDHVQFQDEIWQGQTLQNCGPEIICRIRDAGFVYEMKFRLECKGEFYLYRWANFLRFAGMIYQGQPHLFSSEELKKLRFYGSLRLIKEK